MDVSGTIDVILSQKGREIFAVSPEMTVYDAIELVVGIALDDELHRRIAEALSQGRRVDERRDDARHVRRHGELSHRRAAETCRRSDDRSQRGSSALGAVDQRRGRPETHTRVTVAEFADP